MKFFQTHEKLIIWIVVVIIIPVFGIGTLLTAMIGGRKGKGSYGRLGGKKITQNELAAFATKHDFRRFSTDQVIQAYRQFKQFENLGFKISDREVAGYIHEKGNFADENGKFSNKMFKKYLKRNNLSQELFIESVKEKLLIEKLGQRENTLLKQVVPVTKDDILFKYHYDNDRYKVKYAMIPVEKLPKEEIPVYEEIKAVYNRARAYSEAGGEKAAEAFYKEFPLRDDLFKQWVIVEYIGISTKGIEKNLELKDSAILEYYAEHREDKYRIKEEKKKEDKKEAASAAEDKKKDAEKPEGKDNKKDKKEKPKYKPLDDNLKKEIRADLTKNEADRIVELLKDKINERKIDSENKDQNISLKDLASRNYFAQINVADTFVKKNKQVVYHDISSPIDLPRTQFEMYTKGFAIDNRLGRVVFQDLQQALMAVTQPDTEIATSFLKTNLGYCMFIPKWWPNMNLEDQARGRIDLTYTVPFPDKKTLGLEKDTGIKELPDTPKEQSLLDIKLDNMRLKASITLYNSIKKHLTDKKAKDKARNKAEEIYAEINPQNFDKIADSKGTKIKTRPFETIPDGGTPVQACYHLALKKEKSEIFFNPGGGRSKTTPFYGVGILLEKEKAKDTEISQKEMDRIRSLCLKEKQSDYLAIVELLNTLPWDPK